MKKEIGKNVSSGAEKVERVEEISQADVDTKKPQPAKRKTAKKSASEKNVKKTPETAKLKEEKAAAERTAAAKERAEKKQKKIEEKVSYQQAKVEKKAAIKEKKLEKKRALAEKRLERKEMIAKKKAERIENRRKRSADLKAKKAERRAERAARKETLRHESKAERQKRIEREKKERLALRRKKQEARERAREEKIKAREAARARRAEDKKHKREEKSKRRTPGFGGWLAAVISLGTACLVLAAVVTAGGFRMNDMAVATESDYRATLYEMVSVSEDLDENLGKLRISSGAGEQGRLLTDILVDSALLESAIEKIPVDNATSTDISSFVNRTNRYARAMLAKISSGTPLSAAERETVARLYEINDRMYNELNELANNLSSDMLREFLAGGGEMMQAFSEISEGTHSEISDAPFSKEGNIGENRINRLEEVSSAEAEEAARGYFAAYHIRTVKYTGETVTQDISCYDFVLTDENGGEIFCQISKNGGKLVFFDSYEVCTQKNFDLEECDALAREFLKGIGVEDVEAVWLSDGGMVANLTYTTVQSGVRIYPEIIRVRVCEEKGRVIGLDAKSYLLNDKTYPLDYALTKQEALGKLAEGLDAHSVNLALVPAHGRVAVCYEIGCSYGEDEYIVYVDANTGEEVNIFRVRESARGSYLR